MKYTLGAMLLAGVVLVGAQAVSAKQEKVDAVNDHSGVSVTIPAHAVQVADHVFSLGTTYDAGSGEMVEGYMIVHPKEAQGKPAGTPGKVKPAPEASCYTFLASNARWKNVEPWIVNPSNPDGISDASVLSILENGIAKWEDAADGTVGNTGYVDILGFGSTTGALLSADQTSTDGMNEVYFDTLDEGTIGVTIVWGVFGGNPKNRKLVEWDQVYNTLYAWSDTGVADAMDFENIATHELGHSVGMGDLYDTACSVETMYGYGSEGEIIKRDLNSGDVAGISALY